MLLTPEEGNKGESFRKPSRQGGCAHTPAVLLIGYKKLLQVWWVVGILYPSDSEKKGNDDRQAIFSSVTCNLLIILFLFKIPLPFFTGANPFIRIVLPLLGFWQIHSFKSCSNVTFSVKASLIAVFPLSFSCLSSVIPSTLYTPDFHTAQAAESMLACLCICLPL